MENLLDSIKKEFAKILHVDESMALELVNSIICNEQENQECLPK